MKGFAIKKLSAEQKALRRRILELSHKLSFSHIGSCLSAVDLINTVYKVKHKNEIFVLSNGHAGVALYTVLEKYGYIKKETSESLRVHPDRNIKHGIHVSTGSLGQGLPIALGMAIAKREKNVYCMISDGECAEGSIWESFRLAEELKLENLVTLINANGWGAYDPIQISNLIKRVSAFGGHVIEVDGHDEKVLFRSLNRRRKNKPLVIFAKTTVEQLPFLNGLDAHYYVMKQEDFEVAMEKLI